MPNYCNNNIVQFGIGNCSLKGRQGIEPAGMRIDQRDVVRLPPWLVFFTTLMMVNRKQNTFIFARSST